MNDSGESTSGMAPGLPAGASMEFGAKLGDGMGRAGDEIGPYRLLEVLGEGGFGVVWLAERREPMRQLVALKTLKPGMDSRSVLARFEQERAALACMNHPNIARIFDGGLTIRGYPYFVMELVRGQKITEYCDSRRMSIAERLKLFVQVCDAVQHAHNKGVAHRDLKPSNILVMDLDGKAIPKVIDFGVAKVMAGRMGEASVVTSLDARIGTLAYMSPEQAGLGSVDVDLRTDVYSLGVVLYELLAGVLPFEPGVLASAARGEAERIIRESEPLPPSSRLSEVGSKTAQTAEIAQKRGIGRAELVSELKGELEWVPLMAMRKERGRRYQTARELAEDVGRYLAHEPLRAGPESADYRARKFLRRHAGAVAITAAGVVAMGTMVFLGQRWSHERDMTQLRAKEATALRTMVEITIDAMNPGLVDRDAGEKQPLDRMAGFVRSGGLSGYGDVERRIRERVALSMAYRGDSAGAARGYAELVEQAEREGDTELIADYRLSLGAVYATNGNIEGLTAQIAAAEVLPSVTSSAANRARLLGLRGSERALKGAWAEALEFRQQARIAALPMAGEQKQLIFSTQLAMGGALIEMGRFSEAEAELREASETWRTGNLGPAHGVKVGYFLGRSLVQQGKSREGGEEMLRSLAGPGQFVVQSDRDLLDMREWLARALSDQERFVEASAIAYQGIEPAQQTKEKRGEIVLLVQFGIAAREVGAVSEAGAALRRAVKIAKDSGDGLREGVALWHLAELERQRHDLRSSEPLAARAVELLDMHGASLAQRAEARSVLEGVRAGNGVKSDVRASFAMVREYIDGKEGALWRRQRACERMGEAARANGLAAEGRIWDDLAAGLRQSRGGG